METNFLTLKMRDTPFLGGNFEAESSREFTRGFYGWAKEYASVYLKGSQDVLKVLANRKISS